MMATHKDMDDVNIHGPASPYGIQKLNCEYMAHMFDTDHVDGDVFNSDIGIYYA